jgi:phospholipid/cholesterol/gamma-HCH transport system permease protein
MTDQKSGFQLQQTDQGAATLLLTGDWVQGQADGDFQHWYTEISALAPTAVTIDGSNLGEWDSLLMSLLLQCHDYCQREQIDFSLHHLPANIEQLLQVATAVKPHQPSQQPTASIWHRLDPAKMLARLWEEAIESLAFIGDVALALFKMVMGRANTRFSDFRQFCYQAGPDGFGIISLTSVLVGMILAYLGAVQLAQFGAEIYVADLVVIGMLREMGVLMTAIVMAGRTGAAYAAQLGTMQTNEEIDAIVTMGVSPIEFLVVPRMLALVMIMPLLTLYANLLGIVGGGIVAGGMGITPLQYINEGLTVLAYDHLVVGMVKSLVFGMLIAVAGCRAGINSGRSSAAVGEAATEAVVTAIVYLIVADAAINIICQQLEL